MKVGDFRTKADKDVRDWSLITGRGATKRERGHVKFFPLEKEGRK